METLTLAATTSGDGGSVAAVMLMVGCYLLACTVWPQKACRHSGGRAACGCSGRTDRVGTRVLRALGWGGR